MKINPQRFLFSLALLLLVLMMASCTGASAPASPSASLPPASSPVPTDTATPTVEPTMSPNQIAKGMEGLNPERNYIVQGNYLVDTYNNAPKAARAEDGSWRELDYNSPEDAEMMYGHLVPEDLPYIDTRDLVNSYYGKAFGVQMVYLGDVSWEQEEFNGRTVDMAYLLAGLRDGENNIHIVKYGVDAMNTGTPHWFEYSTNNVDDPGYKGNYAWTENIEAAIKDNLKPGNVIVDHFIFDPSIKVDVFKAKEVKGPPENENQYREITTTLFNQNKAEMMTREEWKQLGEEKLPGRVVSIYPVDRLDVSLAPILDW